MGYVFMAPHPRAMSKRFLIPGAGQKSEYCGEKIGQCRITDCRQRIFAKKAP
jgi:hypothetical protein